jgi:hypothetical protein
VPVNIITHRLLTADVTHQVTDRDCASSAVAVLDGNTHLPAAGRDPGVAGEQGDTLRSPVRIGWC